MEGNRVVNVIKCRIADLLFVDMFNIYALIKHFNYKYPFPTLIISVCSFKLVFGLIGARHEGIFHTKTKSLAKEFSEIRIFEHCRYL